MRGKRKFICLNYHATKNLIFSDPGFANAPDAAYGEVTIDGVAPGKLPQHFHVSGVF